MIKALLFDLDDSLYPERKFVESGFKAVSRAVARRLGTSDRILHDQLIKAFKEGIRGKTFDIVLERIGVEPSRELISQMVDIYRSHTPKIKPYRDVPMCLPRFAKRYELGLITDGYSEVQRRKVKALGIARFFQLFIFSDDFNRDSWKPSTVPYQVALDKLHVGAHEAIYIGDNPHKDFVAAKQLGLTAVRIKRKGGEYSNVRLDEMHEADYEVSSLEELDMLLHSIDGIDGD